MSDPRRLPNLPAATPTADDLIYLEQDGVSSRAALGDLPLATAASDALAGKQPLDADLTAIAALTTTSYGRALLTTASTGALKTALALNNLDNTSDANKPVSTATQTALDGKQPLDADLTAIAGLTTTSYGRSLLTTADTGALKTALAVDNVDNTSDANKPVSTATQTALAGKQPLDADLTAIAGLTTTSYGRAFLTHADAAAAKPALALTKDDVGLGSADNTSDANKPVSTAQQTALNLKATIANPTFTGDVTLGQDPTQALHAVTKQYVDATIAGLDPKASVAAATTANITLSGAQTVDGVAVSIGARVLVKNQSTASQNGIYLVASGAWTRTPDMDNWSEVPGANTYVEGGSVNGGTGWFVTASAGGTIGGTSMAWSQNSGPGTITAGTGTAVSGLQIALTGQALALHSLGTNGLFVRTGSGTVAARTITGTANEIAVTNGDGVSGNPTLSLPSAITLSGKTVTGGTFAGPSLTTPNIGAATGTSLTLSSSVALDIISPTTSAEIRFRNTTNASGFITYNGTDMLFWTANGARVTISASGLAVVSAISGTSLALGGATIGSSTLSAAGTSQFDGNIGVGTPANSYANYNTVTIGGTTGGGLDFESNTVLIGNVYANATLGVVIGTQGTLPLNFKHNTIIVSQTTTTGLTMGSLSVGSPSLLLSGLTPLAAVVGLTAASSTAETSFVIQQPGASVGSALQIAAAVGASGGSPSVIFRSRSTGGGSLVDRMTMVDNKILVGASGTPTSILQVKSGGTGFANGISLQANANDSFLGLQEVATGFMIRSSYVTTGSFKPLILSTSDTDRLTVSAAGAFLLGNADAAPSAPGSGGVLYVDGGTLKYKGSSGTATTLAAA